MDHSAQSFERAVGLTFNEMEECFSSLLVFIDDKIKKEGFINQPSRVVEYMSKALEKNEKLRVSFSSLWFRALLAAELKDDEEMALSKVMGKMVSGT